jgi:endoglucanase Acf2
MDASYEKERSSVQSGIFNSSTIVLIITGIYALLGLGFIVAAILVSENKLKNVNQGNTGNTGSTGFTGFFCSGPGTTPQISPPSYERISPKSICSTSLSDYSPTFTSKNHTVQKLYRARALNEIVSPNHWIGNALYGTNGSFNVYPYHGRIEDDGFVFSWPTRGILTEHCDDNSTGCPTGDADLSFNVNMGPRIKIGSTTENSLSCDILDIDALVSTVAWQYQNSVTQVIGSITIPLAKGSPFITTEVNNIDISLECDFDFTVDNTTEPQSIYIIQRDNASDGYLLILSRALSLTIIDRTIYIPSFSGVVRIGYFNSETMIDILMTNYTIYPIESTISTSVTGSSGDNNTTWNVDTVFEWTTRSMNIVSSSRNRIRNSKSMKQNLSNDSPLMLALPHHNIINVVYESDLMLHPLIGPFRFLTTDNNTWVLGDAVANYTFAYPPIGPSGSTGMDTLATVWETEMSNIINSPPRETVNWCRWLGSVANLLLIGDMLGNNITTELNVLKNNLSLIQTQNGTLSPYNTFIHDKTWGGVIGNLGLNNCAGNSDNGNAFYNSHIGQFGYLVFAYAVAGYFDQDFINSNSDTALLFVRDIVNPYEFDNTFPLWRNKDWYFGYSISSGLSPQQGRGKETLDIGETILGYYASYLISLVLTNQDELMNWSLAMLASEIISLQYYFQFVSQNRIDVDPAFVQGTIVERGDTYYEYTVDAGNDSFPARNASIMVPILKPLSLISFDYLNQDWSHFVQFWMTDAVTAPDIEPESFGYAETLLSVQASPQQRQMIANNIANESHIYLPYGSTWSSMLYWVLNQG